MIVGQYRNGSGYTLLPTGTTTAHKYTTLRGYGATVTSGGATVTCSYEVTLYPEMEPDLTVLQKLKVWYWQLKALCRFGAVVGLGASPVYGLMPVIKYWAPYHPPQYRPQVRCPMGAYNNNIIFSFVDHKRGRHINIGKGLK